MNLVIVESPTKSKTISKFLGKEYKVLSSFGHIRDLPKSELGVDVENNFKPKYIIPAKSKKTAADLKKAAKNINLVILATDEDREGEAIAWHLSQILNLDGKKPYERIVFHEITKKAVEDALENPRKINLKLVDSQQARRILDRLVGYKLSPFLWKKVVRGLSAGRVQSVAVRLIVDREREIDKFKPEEYWTVEALLKKDDNEFPARLIKQNGKTIPKLGVKIKEDADKILKDLKEAEYKIAGIQKKEIKKYPAPPFTTSTLQQTAVQKLGFSAKQTMRIAQQLYEGINLGKVGSVGLITYHRTDSLNLSQESLGAAQEFIKNKFGANYSLEFPRIYKTKSKTAQEAHEAIRPTEAGRQPESIKKYLNAHQYKLYDLVWKRFIACQTQAAVFDSTVIDVQAKNYTFRATGQILKFDGFLKIYPVKFGENILPLLNKDEILRLIKLISEQHFTQPPARYSEATLIKILEEYGIGRPSTYAPIISTIQDRGYVIKNEQRKFTPTEIGFLVNDLLVENFPEIVDVKFTAQMENDLDKIAAGEEEWVPTIRNFYEPFHKHLLQKYEEVKKKKLEEPTDKKCPKCGKPLVIKLGRFGKFYACTGFPECKHTEPIIISTGTVCPKCIEGDIVERKTKKGKIFYSCSRWPKCDFALWDKPTGEKCPKCGSLLVTNNKNKIKCSNKECKYQK
ncbi:MAG: DNA topoisomerase I [Candidatus Portnoybacteria bacterium RIFCSPLOWO2_01_FULL_43_11]|uniref:DNA topoisomerase 1 n=3 Tax=Candidatus Portnoyibacteriota TaxID=1817913 RepID=A0A1G2FAC7_9BACT|nr:MAG: DNA topoisomerase I [Candidatus Portnoybacteria bacterium RIFCSPHIGHO2_01_FULL_40_12b]OGZ36917.1 MAG: DNA topoisomerase I [Candidatus Portnoybacteria bacterium RIFCSPHIGHO2_02_FULL_40_23]OGZ38018.1 MAG: DNA topoisomerase I [Candidatus Portnoybacteria bacterium RIFCSPLOWO2_01_FULL_43_11]OGZ39791.1 MAG: DNA topoisomerase I [Candidatus Portnoybacteria bacterium RIFCSPLOWO2_02_FULL_40_15]